MVFLLEGMELEGAETLVTRDTGSRHLPAFLCP